MLSAKEEALIITYMAAFLVFKRTPSMAAQIANVIAKRGSKYTGVLYRGQPYENVDIKPNHLFFSASKDFQKASEFTGEQGTVFVMRAKNVQALDLTQLVFSNSVKVKAECKVLHSEVSNFEDWWKSRDWLAYQKEEGEVLVLNNLRFKKPNNFYCKSQKRRKWCKSNEFITLTADVTRKKK